MAEIRPIIRSASAVSHALGRKLDSIPFSGYHILRPGRQGPPAKSPLRVATGASW
jgi:hypothetical protein